MSRHERTLNRTERLFAIVLRLQNRPNLTTRDLAEEFGVSRRTIFRDLRALSESGVPLTYAEGGGYEILEGYQLPPLMFSAREAATLLLGTSFVNMQSDPALQKYADSVAMKIRSVLPRPVQEYIDQLQQSTVLDPYWVNALHAEGVKDDDDGMWYKLSDAVARQHAAMMEYHVASRDETTTRRVDPLGLVYYSDHWNLIAYCHLRKGVRNFRFDHIRYLRVLMDTFQRPDFDLNQFLEQQGTRPQNHEIKLRFDPKIVRSARRRVPARIEAEYEDETGAILTFYFENLDYVAQWLLGYGLQVEVLKPVALREKMQVQARALADQYQT